MFNYLDEEVYSKDNRERFANANCIKFGKYYTYCGVPCIEIISPEGKTVYLSAFRGYAFQVSETSDGEWSVGETPVFGLETLSTIQQCGNSNLSNYETNLFIIGTVAMEAVNHYCFMQKFFPPAEYFFGSMDPDKEESEWDKFIKNVYLFVRGRKDEVEIVNL